MSSLKIDSSTNIAFYIHHQGAGHVMRAITIASVLNGFRICFLGSNLKPYLSQIPDEIQCIHLPLDVPIENEHLYSNDALSYLHYAPLGVNGIRERTALLTGVFKDKYPILLIVDVSVEITLLARLCGIPSIVVMQHGNRNDLPHQQAYESAEILIAPFSQALGLSFEEDWINAKIVYTGGFSRYNSIATDQGSSEERQNIAVLIGKGGTSIDSGFIRLLSNACPDHTFHIIGSVSYEDDNFAHNIKFHGNVTDPKWVLDSCRVVIGNAGHNTVMEMADLNKRFICIPEERPFEEQQYKAALLAKNGNAKVIQPANLRSTDWAEELVIAEDHLPDWLGVTDAAALGNIANVIKETVERIFKR